MFRFIHGYLPGVWEAQVRAGLVGENDGIRFCQNIMLRDELKFNRLAAKGSDLYKILSARKCPFYIDRIQGGVYIDEYPYDGALLAEYKEMLGDNFWGFQMHEWMSNYRHDACVKLGELSEQEWTKEGIEAEIRQQYPFPYLMLESMTVKEMADAGKPKTVADFYNNITSIYKKRLQTGELIPADSGFLAYAFEISAGAKRLMPEVGAQTPDARVQICYARGMTRKAGRSFGVYYEPWGGEPLSACCYHKDGKNEWGIGESADFPFETQGPNGGSSRSLQRRIFLYAYLSGASFVSEEWGLCNVFYDWRNYELSPYGEVKKEFLDFTRKYTDVGDKLTPIAAVLPKDLMVLDNLYEDEMYCGFPLKSEELARVKRGVRAIFAQSLPMCGSETTCLKNSAIPDALDLLNQEEALLANYQYLIDLTCDPAFSLRHKNLCTMEDIPCLLRKELPCYVEGTAHWLVNECAAGGYYLTIFNHSGIERTVAGGERELPEGAVTVSISVKDGLSANICEGNGTLSLREGGYCATIPAGGWLFIKLK